MHDHTHVRAALVRDLEDKEMKVAPFCLNSRRWLDFCLIGAPKRCPYRGEGNNDCIYEGCGYFELRPQTIAYKRKMQAIWSLGLDKG